jgi:hypothetical protein
VKKFRQISKSHYLLVLVECKFKLVSYTVIYALSCICIYRFRWVAMQLSALKDCNSADEVTIQLKNLPPDLNQSYQQFFAKLNPHHCDIVLTIMLWLAYSKVTLTIDQICEAVAIVKVGEDQHAKFHPGKRWNKLTVERVCADLVIVTDGNRFINTEFSNKYLPSLL